MLLSTVVIVQPLADAALPVTMGNAFYACVLQWIREKDTALAQRIHDANDPKPLTTSPLWGPAYVEDQQLWVSASEPYWLRITSLDPEVSNVLLDIEASPPQALRLHGIPFVMLAFTSHHEAHPWARRRQYSALQESVNAIDRPHLHRVTLSFASATVFRSQGRTRLFPQPRWVFGSLLTRWNTFAPRDMTTEVQADFDEMIDIDRYTLETQMLDFKRYQLQAGFVGKCTYTLNKQAAKEVGWLMHLLTAFAFFSGVGYRTTMGMGQVEILSER